MTGLQALRRLATLLVFLTFGFCVAVEGGRPVPDTTALSAQGRLSLFTGSSTCLQGDYILATPCTGGVSPLLDSYFSTVPLSSYVCQYVSVAGPDVGVECPIIGVQSLTVLDAPYCLGPLLVFDPASTWLQWPSQTCASSYDVIRGAFPGPAANGGAVNLGPVTCLVNDLVTSGSISSTMYGPRDGDVPSPGQAFFYLERATLPSGGTPYGFSSASEPEVPASGDCAL